MERIKNIIKIFGMLCCLLICSINIWVSVVYMSSLNCKVYATTTSSLETFQDEIAKLNNNFETIIIPKSDTYLNQESYAQNYNYDNKVSSISGICSLSKILNSNITENQSQEFDFLSNAPYEVVKDFCNENNYNLLQSENSYQIYKKYSLKRLIVDGNIKNTYGATKDISGYLNYHILCYDSIEATKSAYSKIKNDGYNVFEDTLITTASYADTDYSSTYSSYKSWGAESCDVGGINAYINDNAYAQETIAVAVLDTGINTAHEMFKNRFLYDDSGNIVGSTKYTTSYTYSGISFEDDGGHGTHVAGTIVDLTPENVKIIPIKVFSSSGSGTSTTTIAGLADVESYAKKYKIACVNMSLGGDYSSYTYNQYTSAFASLRDKNILPVVAAGNESDDVSSHLPAYCDNAITVSAVKESSLSIEVEFDDSYSNFGDQVDISAPGTAVNSAYIASSNDDAQNSKGENIYSKLTGTSMATPHVSGAVALLTLYKLNTTYTCDDIENLLYDCCIDLGLEGKDIYYGNGFLNLRFFNIPKIEDEISIFNEGVEIDLSQEYFEITTTSNITASLNNSEYVIYYSLNSLPSKSCEVSMNSAIQIKKPASYFCFIAYKIENNEIVSRTSSKYLYLYYNSGNPEDYFSLQKDGDGVGMRVVGYIGHFSEINFNNIFKDKTITGFDPSVFKKTNIESIILSDSITSIAGYVFYECSKLKNVYAPKVSKVYIAAFYKCPLITNIVSDEADIDPNGSVYLPEVSDFISYVFYGCENLERVELNKLTTLYAGGYQFYNCTKLSSCSLPNITSLPEYIFGYTPNLKTFNIGENVASIGEGVFRGAGIESITCDENNKCVYVDSNKGVYLEESVKIIALKNNESYTILDTYTLNGEQKQVTTLGTHALSGANLIVNELIIPKSIIYPDKEFVDHNITVGSLIIKAENMVSDKYHVGNGVFRVFANSIDSIIIDSTVNSLPDRLFMSSQAPKILQINSKSTTLGAFSLRFNEDKLDHLILNFDDQVDESYINSLWQNTSKSNNINKLSSKTQIPASAKLTNYYSNLKFERYNSETGYYEYSETQSVATNNITVNISGGGYFKIGDNAYTTSKVFSCEQGSNFTYTICPNNGYELSSHTQDGVTIPTSSTSNTISNIQSDVIINITFTPIKYSIYCGLNGGTLSTNNPTSYTIETPTFTLNNPTKTGYTFLGWSGTDLTNPTKTVTIETGSTENRKYYANWEAIEYTISYNLNNGTLSTNNPTTYTIETKTFTLANPTKTGYTFLGWSGTNLDSPTKTVTISDGSIGDREYIANWELIEYIISYILNGGTLSTNNPTSYTIETPTFTLNNPTKIGYTFLGWTGTDLTNPTQKVTIEKGSTDNRKYYANWELIEYTISYNLNNGTLSTNNLTTYTIETKTFTLTNPTKTGYTFLGWTGTDLNSLTISATISDGSIGNREYTANWKIIEYTISYNLNNGTLETENPTSYTIETPTFTLNNPTKEYYEFLGWTESGESEPIESVIIEKGSVGNKKYTANWQVIEYTISYDYAGGSVLSPNKTRYSIETEEFKLTNPTRIDYEFAGWVEEGSKKIKNEVIISKGTTGNKKFTATWELLVFPITIINDKNGTLTCKNFEDEIESGETKTIENMNLHANLEFKVALKEMYKIKSVKVNDEYVSFDNDVFIVENIKAGTTIEVEYMKEINWNLILKYGGIGGGSLLGFIIFVVLIKKRVQSHRNNKQINKLLDNISQSQRIKANSENAMKNMGNSHYQNQQFNNHQINQSNSTYLTPDDYQKVPPKTTYWNMNSASNSNFNSGNNINNIYNHINSNNSNNVNPNNTNQTSPNNFNPNDSNGTNSNNNQ